MINILYNFTTTLFIESIWRNRKH